MDSLSSDRADSSSEVIKIFTPEYITKIWTSQDAYNEVKSIILSEFKECGELITGDKSELQTILIEFFLHSLSFVKLDLMLNDSKCAVWLESLLTLLRSSVTNRYFNKYNDFSILRDNLIQLTAGSKCPLTKEEMDRLFKHINQTYFSHYNLYNYIFTQDRRQDDKIIKYTIDTPLYTPPLQDAHKKVKQDSQVVATEDLPTIQERPARVPLDEQLKNYKYFDVDMETRKKIMTKVTDTRQEMEKQLQDRQKMLEDKIAEIEKEVNAKKRKK